MAQAPLAAEENVSEKQENIEECYVLSASSQKINPSIAKDHSTKHFFHLVEVVEFDDITVINPKPRYYILFKSLKLCD